MKTPRKGHVSTQRKGGRPQAQRRALTVTLTSDFQPPDLCKIKACCLSPPVHATLFWQPEHTNREISHFNSDMCDFEQLFNLPELQHSELQKPKKKGSLMGPGWADVPNSASQMFIFYVLFCGLMVYSFSSNLLTFNLPFQRLYVFLLHDILKLLVNA